MHDIGSGTGGGRGGQRGQGALAVGAVPYCGLVRMLVQVVRDLYLTMYSCIPVT